jgi:signal transduction histidine kinase
MSRIVDVFATGSGLKSPAGLSFLAFNRIVAPLSWFLVKVEESKLFAELKPEEIKFLRQIAVEQTFSAGQEIFKEGDPGDALYLVKDGLVEISGLIGQDVRHVFSQTAPGDMFGEMAVLDSKPRSACAVARRETVVYRIPSAEMLRLAERSPPLMLNFVRELSQRLREFNHQYVREVVQAERLAVIGRFARSIVHDLKNPLNIIGITSEMATMDHATPEYRLEAKLRIRKQVDRISDLISEILEFTQNTNANFVLAPTDYADFIKQISEEIAAEAALKSVAVELESPVPEARLLLNPKRFRRIFYNLIHNATDAMAEGGRVIIRVIEKEKEVVTEIEDTGPGIAPEIADQLFQAFATHGKVHGTGLGLTICKRIIEDHHGWISARNEPGRGAVFSFGLPKPEAMPDKGCGETCA